MSGKFSWSSLGSGALIAFGVVFALFPQVQEALGASFWWNDNRTLLGFILACLVLVGIRNDWNNVLMNSHYSPFMWGLLAAHLIVIQFVVPIVGYFAEHWSEVMSQILMKQMASLYFGLAIVVVLVIILIIRTIVNRKSSSSSSSVS